MLPQRLLPLICLLAPAIAADDSPTSVADLEDPSFIGYYIAPDSTERLSANKPWVTSGSFAGDCVTDPCPLVTECNDGEATFNNGRTSACNDEASCVTMSIFQTYPNGRPIVYNIGCRFGWNAFTVYREIPATTTSSSTSSSSTSKTSSTRTSSTSTSVTETETSTPESQGAESSEDPPKSGSKAWIAGAVVGPIALAIIVGLVIWMKRRKSRAIGGQHAGQPRWVEGKNVHMLNTEERPVELSAPSSLSPSELPVRYDEYHKRY